MEENYIVSARKYRPSTFASVVGQKALTSTLKSAIQSNRLAHAYLFCGSRGVGKTTCARIFAKTINCANPTPQGDPCNECPSCRAFNENRSLNITELDAASNNSVDDIRQLNDDVLIPPVDGKYRVFIVDEVHMLSQAAFNAFLKTLEEPPAHAIFILATTEKHKIIPTILSRCQIYDFKRITIADIIDHLAYVAANENMTADRQALGVIARKADGAMRDALSIFDQVAASCHGQITYSATIENLNILDENYYSRLIEAFRSGDVPSALLIYKEIRDRGFDSAFFLSGLAGFLRDLMVARDPKTLPLLDTDDDTRQHMAQLAAELPPTFFYAAMSLCNDADMEYRTASSKTFLIELLLIKLCQLQSPSPISDGNSGEGHTLRPITPATPAVNPTAPAQPAAPAAPSPASVAPSSASTATPAPPASAATPAPSAAAATPAPPTAAPKPRAASASGSKSAKGRGHLSMFSEAAKTAEATSVASAQQRQRRNPFTVKSLQQAWEAYMELHSKAHVLINTMRASHPRLTADDSPLLIMSVANQPQVDVIEQEKPSLIPYLRSALANDFIELNVEINSDSDSPAAWTDRDLLAHIVKSNPEAGDFISSLDLSLS